MITHFNSLKTLVVTAVIAQCIGGALLAQGVSDADCEKAAAIVSKGHVPTADKAAFGRLSHCGASGGRAIAAAVGQMATETDISVLKDFMWHVDEWRDESVFRAITELATNDAATTQARVFAVRHLLMLLRPSHVYTYAALTTTKVDTTVVGDVKTWQPVACVAQITGERRGSYSQGVPLPTDVEPRIRSTLASLAQSAAVPGPVRNAARCAAAP